jgi:hypothetical protein
LLKIGGGVWLCANSVKFPIDCGDAAMILLEASKERNLSRLWDSSENGCIGNIDCNLCSLFMLYDKKERE